MYTSIETSRSVPPISSGIAHFASYDTAKLNSTMFRYFTGLIVEKFDFLYYHFLKESNMNFLKHSTEDGTPEKVNSISAKLSNADKLYITLMRLKRGFTLQEIAYFVNCNIRTISTIIHSWTQFFFSDRNFLEWIRSYFHYWYHSIIRYFLNC
jgi:hypothetical protein